MSRPFHRSATALALLLAPLSLGGCLVGAAVGVTSAVVGTTVSVAGDVAEGVVNTTGAVVGAAIPDGDKEKDDEDEKD